MEVNVTIVTRPYRTDVQDARPGTGAGSPILPQSDEVRELRELRELPILPESATFNEVRHRMISEAAYLLAARRGFAPGHELDDWLAAEAAVDREALQGGQLILIDRRRR